ncbi:MAG: FAD-dependent oxidoreductase [Planctomycetota bacterium]
MTATSTAKVVQRKETKPIETVHAECCVVGGGPAGLILSLLLARKGVRVALLESHKDFDRDFRGDTIHPSTLEALDTLGLADKLLELPHSKMETIGFKSPNGTFKAADLRRLNTKFPFIALMPQARFLEFIAKEAAKYPTFQLLMGANVTDMIQENGTAVGVRFQTSHGQGEVRAGLTVACDGRASRMRKLAGFETIASSPPMDVLWFRLPAKKSDPKDEIFRLSGGHMLIVLDRGDEWQLGYVIVKGDYPKLKNEGIEALRRSIVVLAPEFADRVQLLDDWKHITPLSVESNRLPVWHKPGLLFIGDAAHAMSPVGGVGINIAIQDAIVTSNMLWRDIHEGTAQEADLAKVQKAREYAVKRIQRLQTAIQDRIVKTSLDPNATLKVPFFLRLPFIRDIPARWIAFGVSHALPDP